MNRSRLHKYQGCEAIFYERPIVARVALLSIVTDQTGLSIKYQSIVTPGLRTPPTSSGSLQAAWEVLDITPHCWTARYVGWALYVNPETVRDVVAQAGTSLDAQTFGPAARPAIAGQLV